MVRGPPDGKTADAEAEAPAWVFTVDVPARHPLIGRILAGELAMNRRLYLILELLASRSQQARAAVMQGAAPQGGREPRRPAMTYVRQNIYSLSGEWPESIVWYAKGVKHLMSLPLDNPLSWRFYGAIHGFNETLWNKAGYYTVGEDMPTSTDQARYWNQCQHRTWYFLPWHRGYLLAFEAAVRQAVIDLNGPKDWALCYWNYLVKGQEILPPAFQAEFLPSTTEPNPLYTPLRFGPKGDRDVFVPPGVINNGAQLETQFKGVDHLSPGFGGPDTGFAHGGKFYPGKLESQPHNVVHGQVGGANSVTTQRGLMTLPSTAALDPIFWLHHANIDRLWEVWRRAGHADPTDQAWLDGPAAQGERAFIVPQPGQLEWTFTPAQMSDYQSLDYVYDDLPKLGGAEQAPSEPQSLTRAQLGQRGITPGQFGSAGGAKLLEGTPELVGANLSPIRVFGRQVETTVQIDDLARPKLTSARAATGATGPTDRLALNIEKVRGQLDSVTLTIFLGFADPGQPGAEPDQLVDSIGLFGLQEASERDGPHGGEGLNFILDISEIAAAGLQNGSWSGGPLMVRFVSMSPVPDWANITIEKVSAYWLPG
jgi:tyrosinase